MVVITYLREVAGLEDPDLLQLWKDSWSQAGWEPVVVGPAEADRSPLITEVRRHRNFFVGSSGNPADYQVACIERWCAASVFEPTTDPIFMADWDMINYGLGPAEVAATYADGSRRPVFYSPGSHREVCPASVFMTPLQYRSFARWFIARAEAGEGWDANHDEALLMGPVPWPLPVNRVHEAPHLNGEIERWRAVGRRPRLVHFSNGSTKVRPRSALVRRGHPIDA